MPATYQVVGKHHFRATFTTQESVDARGNVYTVTHAGPSTRLEVGALVDDLSPDELAAFPDRFQLVSGDALVLPDGTLRSALMPRVVNPELIAMVRRAHLGQASKDEEAIVGDVLAFLADYAAGTATPEDVDALQLLLDEFGLTVFV